MMKKGIILLFAILQIFISCSSDYEEDYTPTIVVEGWIDEGEPPYVILSRNVPTSQDWQDVDNLTDYIVRWAKVTISDGTQEVILTGMTDQDYFPPYIYTTNKMVGEIGKTYTLTVEYDDFHATAETTVPTSVPIDSVSVERISGDDRYVSIKLHFTDPDPSQTNYYKVSTIRNCESTQYTASYFSLFSDQTMTFYGPQHNHGIIPVTQNQNYRHANSEYTSYFEISDTVQIKFAHLSQSEYNFWEEAENMNNFSRNMFFSYFKNLPSNINGGMGYFHGYGASKTSFIIAEKISQ